MKELRDELHFFIAIKTLQKLLPPYLYHNQTQRSQVTEMEVK